MNSSWHEWEDTPPWRPGPWDDYPTLLWRTKEETLLSLEDMEDAHLIRALIYVEQNWERIRNARKAKGYIDLMEFSSYPGPNGDAAQDMHSYEERDLMQMAATGSMEYFEEVLEGFYKELKFRKLSLPFPNYTIFPRQKRVIRENEFEHASFASPGR